MGKLYGENTYSVYTCIHVHVCCMLYGEYTEYVYTGKFLTRKIFVQEELFEILTCEVFLWQIIRSAKFVQSEYHTCTSTYETLATCSTRA